MDLVQNLAPPEERDHKSLFHVEVRRQFYIRFDPTSVPVCILEDVERYLIRRTLGRTDITTVKAIIRLNIVLDKHIYLCLEDMDLWDLAIVYNQTMISWS